MYNTCKSTEELNMSIDIMVAAEILRVRTPAGIAEGYADVVGQTLPVTGNAYHGFEVILPDGERRNLIHYYYNSVLKD
jgi:hypothetical protein